MHNNGDNNEYQIIVYHMHHMTCFTNDMTANVYWALWCTSHHSLFLHVLTHLFLTTLLCRYYCACLIRRNLGWMVSHFNLNLCISQIQVSQAGPRLQGLLLPPVAPLAGQTDSCWEASQAAPGAGDIGLQLQWKGFWLPNVDSCATVLFYSHF